MDTHKVHSKDTSRINSTPIISWIHASGNLTKTFFCERFTDINASHYFLSPMASPTVSEGEPDPIKQSNTRKATYYCLTHPQWRLTLQMHKIIGID